MVFDFVSVREGCLTDLTRVVSLGGLPAELRRAYDAVLRVEAAVVGAALPRVTCRPLYDIAGAGAAEEGLAEHLVTVDEPPPVS